MASEGETFAAAVEAWVLETEQRMLDVTVTAVSNLIDDAQTTTDRGGRMRYKTGFLSASGRAAIGQMPSGPNVRPVDATVGQYKWDGEAVNAALLDLKPGETFYYGWTANYAQARNLHDGFLDAPVQNWQKYVDGATVEVKRLAGER